jgi:hypothetical protein
MTMLFQGRIFWKAEWVLQFDLFNFFFNKQVERWRFDLLINKNIIF